MVEDGKERHGKCYSNAYCCTGYLGTDILPNDIKVTEILSLLFINLDVSNPR